MARSRSKLFTFPLDVSLIGLLKYIHFNDHVIETSKLQGLDARKQDLLIGRRTTVLCSMAQLSSPNLIAILRRKQLRHIILDEAFQLATYNLPHILEIYRKSLRRLSVSPPFRDLTDQT